MASPDPHRRLESDAPDAVRWVAERNAEARARLDALPLRRELAEAIARHASAWGDGVPQRLASGWLWIPGAGGSDATAVQRSETLDGPRQTVCLARDLLEAPAPAIEWCLPSPDGSTLAVAVSSGGDMRTTLRIVALSNGDVLTAPDLDLHGGRAAWSRDGGELYCWRAPAPSDPADAVARLVVLGPGAAVRELDGPPPGAGDSFVPQASPDGSALLLSGPPAHARLSWALELATGRWTRLAPTPEEARDQGPAGALREVHVGCFAGSRYLAIAFDRHPRGEVVACAADRLTTAPEWHSVFVDERLSIRALAPFGARGLVVYGIDAGEPRVVAIGLESGTVERLELDRGASIRVDADLHQGLGQLPLIVDGERVLMRAVVAGGDPALIEWRPDGGRAAVAERPSRLGWQAEHARLSTRSADGHAVSYEVVAPPGATGSLPTLIYAYGGFHVTLACGAHPGAIAPWVEAGGRVVVAHLRGDGDDGHESWLAGRREAKPRVFDDLFAVAEDLCRRGLAEPATLALAGVSNGSLLIGAAARSRPELFRAMVAMVPLFDLERFTTDRRGAWLTSEYGDPAVTAEARWLSAWSPYENLEATAALPATLVVVGESDVRIAPWHGRKMAAALREAGGAEARVLLRSRANRGHQSASLKAPPDEAADWLGFLMAEVGLQPASTDSPEK